jgi:hypothetical protein
MADQEVQAYSDRNNPVDMQYLNRFNTESIPPVGNVYMDLR